MQPLNRLGRATPFWLLATLACGQAMAEEASPYFIGVTQSLTHDSNVYRVPQATSDNYASTGLVGGLDQRISRQHIVANASVQLNRYRSQSTLNNTSYSLSSAWDFTALDKLSGGLSLSALQSLASVEDSATRLLSTRNIAKTEQYGAHLSWGGEGVLSLTSAYAHSHVHYSAPEFDSAESTQDSASLGAHYRVGPTLSLGTAVRLSRAVAPKGSQVAPGVFDENRTKGRNLDLTADWRSSDQTAVNARLSWTRQTNTGVDARDFSGLTGALSASIAPTAKLSFNASFSRDAGANASFFNLANKSASPATSGLSENSQVANTFALGAGYAATAKIKLNAGAQYRHSKLVDSINLAGIASSEDRTDNTKSFTLGVRYDVAHNWSLACNVARVTRDVSANAAAAAFAYSANTTDCSAQFTLR